MAKNTIYAIISKETVSAAQTRAVAALRGAICGNYSIEDVFGLVDEIRELDGIMEEFAKQEEYAKGVV